MTLYKKRTLSFVNFQSFLIMSRLQNSCLVVILMMAFLSFSSSAEGMDSLSEEQNLLSSCNAFKTSTNNANTLPCLIYIKGFLNGVLNANNTDVDELLEDDQESTTLVDRAYASRVGIIDRANAKPIDYACLSMDESKQHIIENLSDSSLNSINTLKQLNARLVYVLKTSCTAETQSE